MGLRYGSLSRESVVDLHYGVSSLSLTRSGCRPVPSTGHACWPLTHIAAILRWNRETLSKCPLRP